MKRNSLKNILYGALLLCIGGCIQSYDPPSIGGAKGLLVIEGYLDVASGSSSIKLTRTQDINDDTSQRVSELKAKVSIEDESGTLYNLKEGIGGVYTISGLQVSYGTQYRLKIKTNTNKDYISDFVATKQTPDIDSVSTKPEGSGMRVSVNTHDPSNSTKYYRWEYTETWEYISGLRSDYVYTPITKDSGTVTPRTDNVFLCWRTQNSTNIIVGSSEKLAADVISDFSLTLADIMKIKLKYSVLVKQSAISKDEYDYWQELKKNNENTGGLFSPQPTQVAGNMHCTTDPTEVVIGYFSAYEVKQQRIFRGAEPPAYFYYVVDCDIDTVAVKDVYDGNTWQYQDHYLISGIYDMMSNALIGYSRTSKFCADCIQVGIHSGANLSEVSNTPPGFWQ